MDTDPAKHPNRFRFGSSNVNDQRIKIINRKNLTKSERVFIFNLLYRRLNLEDAYRDAYKTQASGTKILKRALLLIKQERVLAEIKKAPSDILLTLFAK